MSPEGCGEGPGGRWRMPPSACYTTDGKCTGFIRLRNFTAIFS